MLVLDPEVVRFEDVVWEDVLAVALERKAEKLIAEWGDDGPHAAMVDVVEQRVIARVTRRPERGRFERGVDSEAGLSLGREGVLTFYSSTDGSGAARTRVTVRCVLVGVRSDVKLDEKGRTAAVQVLEFVGVSPNGGAHDPVSVSAAIV